MSTRWAGSYLCRIMYSIPEVGFISSRCCVFLIVMDQLIAIKYALKQQRIRSIRLLFFLYTAVFLVIACHIVRAIHINISNVTCYPFAVTTTDTILEWFVRLEVTVISITVITSTSCMYYSIVKTVQKSSCKIRSSMKSSKTITSIIQHAVGIIGIEVVNLLSVGLLSSVSFYWSSNTNSRANYAPISYAHSYSTQNTISVLISIMTLLMSSLHVVFFGLKQYRRIRITSSSRRITYAGTLSERNGETK